MNLIRRLSLELSRAGTAVAASILAAAVLGVGPAAAEWRKAESQHFIVYGDMSEGEIRSYIRKVEKFDALMRLYFPITRETETVKLPIYVAEGLSDLRAVAPGMGSGVAGFYYPGDGGVFAIIDRRRTEGTTTLFHEYGHHFMLQNFSAAYPGWFIEGFAEYFATAEVDDQVKVGLHRPGRMNSLTQGANTWVPMENVLGSQSSGIAASKAHAHYAQAWALTHYLMSDPERRARLSRYLAAISDGADPIAALPRTLGRTPDQLQSDIRRYLSGAIPYATLKQEFPAAEVTVTSLPESANDVIWLDLRLNRGEDDDDKAALLAQARAAMARHPGDHWAGLVLAKAQMAADQPQDAIATLEPLIARSPDDASALRLAAMARMEQADAEDGDDDALYGDARRLLARAYQADPLDFRIYLAMAHNRRKSPGYPTDNDVEVLRLAAELAPQVMSVRYQAAQVMMHKGLWTEALPLLAPVANNPHGGEQLAAARAALSRTRQQLGQTALPNDPAPNADDDEGSAEPVAD